MEDVLEEDIIYKGKIITVRKQQVQLPNGKIACREIVDHQPAVVIIPVCDDGKFICVRQYRKAVDMELLEFPAGCVEENETFLIAAQRELKEECGCIADSWTYITQLFPTPGFCNELYVFYMAKSLHFGDQNLDDDENVSVETYDVSDLERLIKSGDVKDMKTVFSFYWLKSHGMIV